MMNALEALYSLQVAPVQSRGKATQSGLSGTTSPFAELLAKAGQTAQKPTEVASQMEEELLAGIEQQMDGAPDYFYAFHPEVFPKMAADPDFAQRMVNVVNEWTGSERFQSAKGGGSISALLVGEDGEYTMPSLSVGLWGELGIQDFLVSQPNLTNNDKLLDFLSQFNELPEDVWEALLQNANRAHVAGSQSQLDYYQALAGMAQVQKNVWLGQTG